MRLQQFTKKKFLVINVLQYFQQIQIFNYTSQSIHFRILKKRKMSVTYVIFFFQQNTKLREEIEHLKNMIETYKNNNGKHNIP